MAKRGGSLSLAAVPRAVRQRYGRRSDRLSQARSVRDALISLAGLVGRPVLNHEMARQADAYHFYTQLPGQL